jgi:hypothetical protein
VEFCGIGFGLVNATIKRPYCTTRTKPRRCTHSTVLQQPTATPPHVLCYSRWLNCGATMTSQQDRIMSMPQ